MAKDIEPTTAKPAHPEWVLELDGADLLLEQGAIPKFKSGQWTVSFSLPSDLSELEGVADPLLFVYAGSGFVRDVESKMDRLVAMAREQGRSWTEIGRALGVTMQTASARLSRVVAEVKTSLQVMAPNTTCSPARRRHRHGRHPTSSGSWSATASRLTSSTASMMSPSGHATCR